MSKAARPKGTPSREAIAAFVRDNPQKATKRDIARAFGLKGGARVALKHVLRELEEEGLIEKRGKRLATPGSLPPVMVLEVTGRDPDGGLLARPIEWDTERGAVPRIAIAPPKKGRAKVIVPGVGDRVLTRIGEQAEDGAYAGRVIKRLDRKKAAVLGVVRRTDKGGYRIEPTERKQSEMEVDKADLGGAKPGDLVEVETTRSGRHGLSKAKVLEVIGSLKSEKAVSMIAIHAHGIPHIFPDEVLAEAEAAKRPKLKPPREDWRDVPLITIDPETAKDHDDAVHGAPDDDPKNPGGHIVTVAIADVAHFVRPGSALDREAQKRGNSVYFPDRVVPMLPERISNDLCSLRENEDRPAMAVRMVFDASGRKTTHSFHRIMMRSHAKLSYEQAQQAIDGAPDETAAPVLDTILKPLWAAYRCLLKGRKDREPLELDIPEREIVLGEDGTVDKVVVPPRLDAHKLIEECMIQANVAAAETLEKKKQALVFRIHDAPALAKQEALREFLKTLDIPLARGAQLRPSAFNAILDRVEDTDHSPLVHGVVLRSQSQAEYSPDNIGHFGLNLKRYAHFTSPIRRYADLIVHRALIRALGLGDGGDELPEMELDQLREIAGLISSAERRAVNAERDTVDRLIAEHLDGRVGETFDARVSGMTGSGLFVTLDAYGADGFIPASKLGEDYYRHDEALHAMVGERTGQGYRLGDAVEVRLAEVQALAGAIRFDMESDPRDLGKTMKSRHKATRGQRSGRPARRSQRAGRGKGKR
ncbi:ribonuclease R [Roseitalea porphyridii]|uniref:Ribonuclease R n=1 Tax=Roseitalea porphyridii TaxID=1852022 RepID=A0A4V1A3V5_9HYPH|nr:ribonuclease R [Roseitalea porphyridii]QBK30438.1 ribonuclease R [Roseitalea porphyridii]